MKNIPTSQRVIEIKHKRRVRLIRFLFLFVILFLVILLVSAYFSYNERVSINEINVEGVNIIDKEEIVEEVKAQLEGKHYLIYNKANSFIYPEKAVYNNLLQVFPRIEELSIKREGLNTLSVRVTERMGSYLYCGKEIPKVETEIGENCYFVNNDGFIFDKAPYFSGSVYFKYYTEIEDQNNPLNQNIFQANRFHELIRFMDGITNLNLEPISLVEENGVYSLNLKYYLDNSRPKIIFKEDSDLIDILDNLEIAMDKEEFSNEINSKYKSLEYIDLRFKNKVLYKFK